MSIRQRTGRLVGLYVGNDHDEVLRVNTDVYGDVPTANIDISWVDPGVPYRLRTEFRVAAASSTGAGPMFTLHDGVRVIAEEDTRLGVAVTTPGAITVDGHTEGVRLEGDGTVGSWDGLLLGFGPDTFDSEASSIVGLTVRDAGHSQVCATLLKIQGGDLEAP